MPWLGVHNRSVHARDWKIAHVWRPHWACSMCMPLHYNQMTVERAYCHNLVPPAVVGNTGVTRCPFVCSRARAIVHDRNWKLSAWYPLRVIAKETDYFLPGNLYSFFFFWQLPGWRLTFWRSTSAYHVFWEGGLPLKFCPYAAVIVKQMHAKSNF